LPKSRLGSELFGHEKGAFTSRVTSALDGSSSPAAARSSWMRSAKRRSSCGRSCCACCWKENSNVAAVHVRFTQMPGWWPLPAWICPRWGATGPAGHRRGHRDEGTRFARTAGRKQSAPTFWRRWERPVGYCRARWAAWRMGLNRSTLQFRMKKLGIERPALGDW